MTLTKKEFEMLKAFLEEGMGCTGAKTADQVKDDNMTWMSASDLRASLGWNKQEIGGVMSALSEKRLIQDSGESPREARDTDWYATDAGIDAYFEGVK